MTIEAKPFTRERKDFSSEAPRFDCLEAVRAHIGECYWDSLQAQFTTSTCTVCFRHQLREYWHIHSEFAIETWWDHHKGERAFRKQFPIDEKRHMKEEYEKGKELGAYLKSLGKTNAIDVDEASLITQSPYPEDFKAGLSDGSGLPVEKWED